MVSGLTVDVETLMACQHVARQLRRTVSTSAAVGTGNQRSKRRGNGMTFHELRPYQHGDELRHVHWKATARTGKLVSKVFTEDHERPLCLWLDLHPGMYFGTRVQLKSALAITVAATLAWSAHFHQERVAAVIARAAEVSCIPAQQPLPSLLALLNQLAAASALLPPGADTLASAQARLTQALPFFQRLPAGSTVMILTDGVVGVTFWRDVFMQLGGRLQLQFIRISDPLERHFTVPGVYPVQGEDAIHRVDMQSLVERQAYQCEDTEAERLLQESCLSHQVVYRHLMTQSAWEQHIQTWSW